MQPYQLLTADSHRSLLEIRKGALNTMSCPAFHHDLFPRSFGIVRAQLTVIDRLAPNGQI